MVDILIESGYDPEMITFNYTLPAIKLKKYLQETHKFPILIRSFTYNPLQIKSPTGKSKLNIVYSVSIWQNYDRTPIKGAKITDIESNDDSMIRAISNDIVRRKIL